MSYTLVIKEEAVDEVSDAFSRYEERKEGLGLEFVSSLEKFLARITKKPL